MGRQGVQVIHVDAYYSDAAQVALLLRQGESRPDIGEHASIIDTSELMATHPQGVDLKRLGDLPFTLQPTGIVGNPARRRPNAARSFWRSGSRLRSDRSDRRWRGIERARQNGADPGISAPEREDQLPEEVARELRIVDAVVLRQLALWHMECSEQHVPPAKVGAKFRLPPSAGDV